MDSAKISFYNRKTFIEPVAFIGLALLAGQTRLIKHCPGATNGGLLLTAAMAGAASSIHDRKYDGEDYNFLRKISCLAIASIVSAGITHSLKDRVALSFTNNLKIMGLGSAVVLVKETLLEESGVQQLRAQIQTKDARITELEEGDVGELQEQLQTANGRVAELETASAELQEQLETANARVAELEGSDS